MFNLYYRLLRADICFIQRKQTSCRRVQSVSELLATGLDQGASIIVLDAAVAMSALGLLLTGH